MAAVATPEQLEAGQTVRIRQRMFSKRITLARRRESDQSRRNRIENIKREGRAGEYMASAACGR